jgi:hypothetical protein
MRPRFAAHNFLVAVLLSFQANSGLCEIRSTILPIVLNETYCGKKFKVSKMMKKRKWEDFDYTF